MQQQNAMDKTADDARNDEPAPSSLLSLPSALLAEILSLAHRQGGATRVLPTAFQASRALQDAALLACKRISCTVTLPSQMMGDAGTAAVRAAAQLARRSSVVGGKPLCLMLRSDTQARHGAAHQLLGSQCHHHNDQHDALRSVLAIFLAGTLQPAVPPDARQHLVVVSLQHLVLDALIPPELTQALPCLQQLQIISACVIGPLRPMAGASFGGALKSLTLQQLDWYSSVAADAGGGGRGAALPCGQQEGGRPPQQQQHAAPPELQAHCAALASLTSLTSLSVHCCRMPSCAFLAPLAPHLSSLTLKSDRANDGLPGCLPADTARESYRQALAALPLASSHLTHLMLRGPPLAPATLHEWVPSLGQGLTTLQLPALNVSRDHLAALVRLRHVTRLTVRGFDDSCCDPALCPRPGPASPPRGTAPGSGGAGEGSSDTAQWHELTICSHSASLLVLACLPLARLQRPVELQRLVVPAHAWPLRHATADLPPASLSGHRRQRQQQYQQLAVALVEQAGRVAAACPAGAAVQLLPAPHLCCSALRRFAPEAATRLLAGAAPMLLLPLAGPSAPCGNGGGGGAGETSGSGSEGGDSESARDSALAVVGCSLLRPGLVAHGLGALAWRSTGRAVRALCLDSCVLPRPGWSLSAAPAGGQPPVSWLARELSQTFPALVSLELCDCEWAEGASDGDGGGGGGGGGGGVVAAARGSGASSTSSSFGHDSDSSGRSGSSTSESTSGTEDDEDEGVPQASFLLDLARCFGPLRTATATQALLPRLDLAVVWTGPEQPPVWHRRLGARRLPELQRVLRNEGLVPGLVRLEVLDMQ